MPALMVYMTASDKQEAERIGQALLEARLAACLNIFEDMEAIFRWEGQVKKEPEVALIAKTREGLFDQLVEKVKEVHSYECPCILALPIADGHKEFLDWIEEETKI